MEIILLSKYCKIKQKIERDLYWYDHKEKRMLSGRGGEIKFVYNPRQKRMIPMIADHEEFANSNDYPQIKKWIRDNQGKYSFSVLGDNGRNVILDVQENLAEDLIEDLYIHKILFDY